MIIAPQPLTHRVRQAIGCEEQRLMFGQFDCGHLEMSD
jgi:hypothetical protein